VRPQVWLAPPACEYAGGGRGMSATVSASEFRHGISSNGRFVVVLESESGLLLFPLLANGGLLEPIHVRLGFRVSREASLVATEGHVCIYDSEAASGPPPRVFALDLVTLTAGAGLDRPADGTPTREGRCGRDTSRKLCYVSDGIAVVSVSEDLTVRACRGGRGGPRSGEVKLRMDRDGDAVSILGHDAPLVPMAINGAFLSMVFATGPAVAVWKVFSLVTGELVSSEAFSVPGRISALEAPRADSGAVALHADARPAGGCC